LKAKSKRHMNFASQDGETQDAPGTKRALA
jgi:hypothetical protein